MVYGPQHNAWGGVDASPLGFEIAHLAGPYYIREFLRWQVLDEISGREAIVKLADPAISEVDFSAEMASLSNWTDSCFLCPFYDGCASAGAACSGPPDVPLELSGLGRPVIYGLSRKAPSRRERTGSWWTRSAEASPGRVRTSATRRSVDRCR